MKRSEIFRENAENCAHLAEAATGEPAFDEQDWLDGEVSPARISVARNPVTRNGNQSAVRKTGRPDQAT